MIPPLRCQPSSQAELHPTVLSQMLAAVHVSTSVLCALLWSVTQPFLGKFTLIFEVKLKYCLKGDFPEQNPLPVLSLSSPFLARGKPPPFESTYQTFVIPNIWQIVFTMCQYVLQ